MTSAGLHARQGAPGKKSGEAGWLTVEMLVTVAAAIALSVLGWRFFDDWMQRAENRQKAIAAVWEVSAFQARANTGQRDVPDVIQDGPGFDLPGGEFVGRGGACLLDGGDAGFTPENSPFQGVVRTCVPCSDSGAGSVPVAALGAITCTPRGLGLPKRCATRAGMRLALPIAAGTARPGAPATSKLMQGLWIPADSAQDAMEIQHYLESDPRFSQLPDIAISRTGDPADPSVTAGLFLCL
ncbi:MAG: hypothetical protein F4Y00_07895 [Bacteroidetes bacterium SB0662_bin_6]|nr:hypothetical protein [Bacteroidetes bacterium SB0662_bin_6]